ncbi:hypothetical protein OURE66S_02821 [Oligella ureolytica]
MSIHTKSLEEFAQQMTEALTRSAQLAREDAIKHGTSLVFWKDGKIVNVTAEELKAQAAEKAKNQEEIKQES